MHRKNISNYLFTLAGSIALLGGASWPQFRGPDSIGVAEHDGLPTSWSQEENIAWRTEVPGQGWSSPITSGDQIFITTVVQDGQAPEARKGLYFGGSGGDPSEDIHHWKVLSYSVATGELLWENEVKTGPPETTRHVKNTFASETCVTDGETLFAMFGNVGIFAFDMEGKLKWKREVEPKPTRYGWGTAASPVLHGDKLFVVNDNDEESYMLALNKETGDVIWRIEREEKSNWATPFVWENELRTELITPGTGAVRSYDMNGELLWEVRGMSKIAIPMPFKKFGMLYVTSGYVMDKIRPVWAIKPGASGDITLDKGQTSNEFIAWYRDDAGPYNPSPIIYGETYYTLLDRGHFTAHNAKTGELIYDRHRIDPLAGAFTASPWAYDGKIFCLSEDGDTFIIEDGPEFKIIGKNSLGEMSMATPAILEDSLILRTAPALYRIKNAE